MGRKARRGRFSGGFAALLGALLLAGCLPGATAPTATPAPPGTIAAIPTRAAPATAGASPTGGTSDAPPALATPAAATPRPAPSPVTPVAGDICHPEPPFGRATAAATATSTPSNPRAPGAALPPQPGQQPPTIPLPHLAAQYTLQVDDLVFAEGRLRATERVRVTNREGCALDRLYFSITAARWGWFALESAQVGGRDVAAAVNGTVLPVDLPQPLVAGAMTEVAFAFRLAVGEAVDPYTPGGFAGTTKVGDILRLAYWFPILSDDHQYPPFLDPPYTATADFDVTLTTPAGLIVAHTGVVADQRENTDGTVTRRIAAPNVRDFVLSLSPAYQIARRQTAGGVAVEVYYDPRSIDPSGRQPERVQQQVGRLLDAATLALDRIGALIGPYPYPVFRVVDGGPALGGGIEFPMLIAVNAGASADLIDHEVGHQWFYGIIGTRTQQDPWIDEGGATFLAAYLGNALPASPPPAGAFNYRLSTAVWAVPAASLQRQATAAIYTQGGAFYTRVLRAMGEPAFWRALQALYRDDRFGIVTPRDLLAAWQAASPVDLRPLFREYFDYPCLAELPAPGGGQP